MVNYSNHTTLLQPHTKPPITIFRPIFRCLPPPQFKQLKQLILEDYYMVKKYMNKSIFITLKHRNLLYIFVKAKCVCEGRILKNRQEWGPYLPLCLLQYMCIYNMY